MLLLLWLLLLVERFLVLMPVLLVCDLQEPGC